MFAKKKETKRRPRPAGSLAQYGIFEVPASIEDIGKDHGMDDDDEDLEAELAALTTGGDARRRPRKTAKRIPDAELNKMVNDSLKDIDSGEELSGDDNDPDLLDELQMITGEEISPTTPDPVDSPEPQAEEATDAALEETVKLLEERLMMYKSAVDKATNENNTSKVRRYGRGVKTLNEMLSSAKSGKQIDTADIPPVLPHFATSTVTEKPAETEASEAAPSVPMEESAAADTPSEPIASTSAIQVDEETLLLLKKRQQEYRLAAVAWKRASNSEQAFQYVKLIKQFDLVIAEINTGNVVDLSDMPGSPTMPEITVPVPSTSDKEESEAQQGPSVEESPPEPQEPLTGSSLEAALKERLEVYRRTKVAAETEGNSSKARRYVRICKQFEDALKMYARGKPIPLEDLPTPPGFPPLTVVKPSPPEPTASPPPKPVPEKQSPEEKPNKPVVPPRANAGKKPKMITSRADKQMLLLQQRQQEFKMAALEAKKEGDLDLARDYLRQAKGIDPLIDASKSGLPVDLNSLPLSPDAKMQLTVSGMEAKDDDAFDLISKQDCLEEATGTDDQIYDNLEAQLLKQIKWCLSTRDHCKALGDVPGYNRWERLALAYTRDLDMLRVRKRNSSPPPQHHYEIKTYAIVQSCTDLNDGDLELSIIRGVNYPKETDTYVIFEFPYPADNHMTDSTSTVRDTSNPEYEAVFPLNGIIDRTSRQCQRTFKRHSLKCQIWSKGGFFKRDSLLGTVSVKLQPLETKCILHDSFPLMDGRKSTGGKLEIKMRLRNPILTKQIDQITDKWLIIDHQR